MLQRVVIGFGSNLGNRSAYLHKAIKLLTLKKNFLFLAVSGIYESEPWGFKNQNNFLNCVAVFLYRSNQESLLQELKDAENIIGRTKRQKWGPREIDMDILFFGNKIINNKKLIIPHPQIKFRNFVLVPLNQIMPGFIHPVFGKRIEILLKNSTDPCNVFLHKSS